MYTIDVIGPTSTSQAEVGEDSQEHLLGARCRRCHRCNNAGSIWSKPHYDRALEIMGFYREIIPFYGRKIYPDVLNNDD